MRQASINLSANVLSALLGLLSVFVFTRLFSTHDYGTYLLGVGFASVISVAFIGWFRNLILSEHARNDGSDVRGLVLSGYFVACLSAPLAWGIGRLVGLDAMASLAAVGLAIAVGLFELTQDLVRARLLAMTAMKATLARAIAVLCLGAVFALIDRTGLLLLASTALAYLVATWVQARVAWRGTIVRFDAPTLLTAARHGLPLTISLTLLAVSSVTDRFMIANLIGAADAGKYIAGLDLVRQTLMMPAISAAAAFFPMAVLIHASQGRAAVRSHLGECAELLLSITLPACLGFAVIAPHIANVVLGADFRETAAAIMPVIAVAVLFQILTQQYLHVSFLLSGRNSFYLINTLVIIAANVILSYALVSGYGVAGGAWARLGADVLGFVCALILSRRAFAVPIPLGRLALTMIAGLIMALIVGAADRLLHVADLTACVILVAVGAAGYAALCWAFDISRVRARSQRGLTLFRAKLAGMGIG
ncbi:lipopolysaccharide biosynthesis protein [uncultured Bradyrhizobium sp.]|uniref:lipopolysaccharide biosynthesis protein n=1 Tax=uncultured Bradyrhizobium sp. TaxID=199684 RepID=UPI0035CC5CAE